MKIILELIERFVSISGNPIIDSILFLFIGFISFTVAFGLVGFIFDAVGKYNSKLMSNVHWSTRIIIFFSLTFIFVKIAQFISWLFSFQWWVYLIVVLAIFIIVILVYLIKYRVMKQINKNNKISEEVIKGVPKSIKEEQNQQKIKIEYDKYLCPRCTQLLVERKGPYGKFIGCSSYPKCNYTRKRF